MTYPIFFPTGTPGWYMNMRKTLADRNNRKRTNVTMREFYAYCLAERDLFNPLHHGSKLLQQFVVDAWMKTEQQRLHFIRTNQAF